MKRTFILIAIAFFLVGGLAICDEATLIDFTLLSADISVNTTDKDGNPVNDQNRRTVMDYGASAGASFTEQQKSLMKTSLALANWEVELNKSAQNVNSLATSRVVAAPVRTEKPNASGSTDPVTVPFAGSEVMGVRILFPTISANSNAKILPPYEIPAYESMVDVDDNGDFVTDENGNRVNSSDVTTTRFEGGYGVVKNVGTIKSISVTTMGMNFPHGLYVRLKDTDGVERRYFMGYLGFDGWKELVWNNPSYISDVRSREIRLYPIYPRGLPFVKFVGFEITRDAAHDGGDFIGYFKDVKIIFDKATLTTERDIADEDLWHIVGDKEAAKQNFEMSRFGNTQVERYLEQQKLATEAGFTSSIVSDSDSSSDYSSAK
ncbi:MAG: flagellar filament outer layer protein FlaA [Spirochaetaceae bacterium]|nr:flagellar filament outer layer protein FlaA [Spirochaetaceae bacterium]MBQ4554931.1 flagellar filament outer layer protein FlaA [Spirochaetaceae bacterium]